MATKFWIVDTFSRKAFGGNPSAVFLLDDFGDEKLLQNVAMEIKTPETIFIKNLQDGKFESRFFSPNSAGLNLGNGLFAAAEIIKLNDPKITNFSIVHGAEVFVVNVLEDKSVRIRFQTAKLNKASVPPNIASALNREIVVSISESEGDLIVEMRSPKKLFKLSPNMDILQNIGYTSFILTADTHYEVGVNYDFCARVFAPKLGFFADTMSPLAYVKLASYWSERMQKTDLVGTQDPVNGEHVSIGCSQEFTYLIGTSVITTIGEMLAF
ncbi:MAG: PhzF family phenazine biosynthesis protein [Holosporales bacterium]|nr:PhzF family phenazine biosynthesis protein [Holosporales bacterium]